MKKITVIICTIAILAAAISAQAANIPKLGKPINKEIKSNITLNFQSKWPFASSCTNLTWHHTGIDIRAAAGESIYAAEKGTVKVSQDSGTSWKEWITIEHKDSKGSKYTTTYWHLKNRKVGVGATVKKGQKIAETAYMPNNTHLHFSIRNNTYTNTANRGGLPKSSCSGYPAFPESFVNPNNYL